MKHTLFQSEKLNKWHQSLNAEQNIPQKGFRRNTHIYPLICYINNIIGCYLSGNINPIKTFINRAREHMKDHAPVNNEQQYYNNVIQYLNELENHLKESGVSISSINE